MGLEITRKTPLNQYEAINHKSAIKLWLHDVVDDIIVPGLISLETLFVAMTENISEGLDELYAPLEHEHPEYEGGGAEFPIGTLSMFGGSTAPSKWLLCNGAAVSRTTYTNLFTVISTVYGVGDGTTTFNVPDFRGRAPIGAGQGSGLTARTLGASLGEEEHTGTIDEMPIHDHSYTLPANSTRASGSSACVSTSSSQTKTTQSAGGGEAHNNIQPSLVVNFIIYSGVV